MYPPVLTTNRFTLKSYSPEDEDRFVEMALDKTSILFMSGSTGEESEERKLFKKILDIYKEHEKRWFWLWGIYNEEALYGHLEMKESEHTNDNELEIVFMIHPDVREKGVMTEVLSFLKLKQKCWNKRIIATVDPENINSISILNKWGVDKKEILLNSDTGKEYHKLTLSK